MAGVVGIAGKHRRRRTKAKSKDLDGPADDMENWLDENEDKERKSKPKTLESSSSSPSLSLVGALVKEETSSPRRRRRSKIPRRKDSYETKPNSGLEVTYPHPRKKCFQLNQCHPSKGIKCSGCNCRKDKLFIIVLLLVQLQPDQRAKVTEPHQPAQVLDQD